MCRRVVAPADAGIALHDPAVVGESAEIVEAVQDGQYLAVQALIQLRRVGLEHRPACCAGNCLHELQTESPRWQLCCTVDAMPAFSQRDRARNSAAPGGPGNDGIQAESMQARRIVRTQHDIRLVLPLQPEVRLIEVLPGTVASILLAQQSGHCAGHGPRRRIVALDAHARKVRQHIRACIAELAYGFEPHCQSSTSPGADPRSAWHCVDRNSGPPPAARWGRSHCPCLAAADTGGRSVRRCPGRTSRFFCRASRPGRNPTIRCRRCRPASLRPMQCPSRYYWRGCVPADASATVAPHAPVTTQPVHQRRIACRRNATQAGDRIPGLSPHPTPDRHAAGKD